MANTPNDVDSIGDLIPSNGDDGDYKWVEQSGSTGVYKMIVFSPTQKRPERRAILYGPREERLAAAMQLISWYKSMDIAEQPTSIKELTGGHVPELPPVDTGAWWKRGYMNEEPPKGK